MAWREDTRPTSRQYEARKRAQAIVLIVSDRLIRSGRIGALLNIVAIQAQPQYAI